jgi:hypothetical protein
MAFMVYSRIILCYWLDICTLKNSVGKKTTLGAIRRQRLEAAVTNREKMEAISRVSYRRGSGDISENSG